MRVQLTQIYLDWINALKDRTIRARIQVRVDRLAHGNAGEHRNLTDGVSELKIELVRVTGFTTQREAES